MMNCSCFIYCVRLSEGIHTQHVWRSEGNSSELLLSFWAMGPGDWSSIFRLSRRCLSHQASSQSSAGEFAVFPCADYWWTASPLLLGSQASSPRAHPEIPEPSVLAAERFDQHCSVTVCQESFISSWLLEELHEDAILDEQLPCHIENILPAFPFSSLLTNFRIHFYFLARIFF